MIHTMLGQFGPPLLFIFLGVLWSVQRRDEANPDDRVWMAGMAGGALLVTVFVWSPYTRLRGTVLFVAVILTLLSAIMRALRQRKTR
jgi:asparagine N-glycosylation enzyme membrane subunit Stt3